MGEIAGIVVAIVSLATAVVVRGAAVEVGVMIEGGAAAGAQGRGARAGAGAGAGAGRGAVVAVVHLDGRDRHHRDRYVPPHGPPPDHYRGRYDDRYGPPPPGFFHGHGPPPPPGPYGGFPSEFPPPPARRGGRASRRDDGPPGVSLLVRNVSPDITQHDLQLAFGRIGDVRDVYIPKDFHSNQPKGFAFIEYASPEMAREARDEMDRFLMKGRELEVVYAQEKRKTPNEMRGRVVDGRNRGGDRGGDFQRSSSFERHKRRERERENYFRPEDLKRNDGHGGDRFAD
ncbi:hypothetical protein ACHAXS_009464 [Conticribra weissflogii]